MIIYYHEEWFTDLRCFYKWHLIHQTIFLSVMLLTTCSIIFTFCGSLKTGPPEPETPPRFLRFEVWIDYYEGVMLIVRHP